MRRVLVTGATGFIGQHAATVLQHRGWEVHAVTSKSLAPTGDIRWHRVNLLDPAGSRALIDSVQPTHLLHLAWYVKPGHFWGAPENLEWVCATVQLARFFSEFGGERLVGAGTCAEYEWNSERCKEYETPWRPTTLYGVSKLCAFQMVSKYFEKKQVSHAWGRIFNLYGPGEYEERLVPSVVRALLGGHPARCSSGTQLRDFLHVEDVARAFVSLLESPVEGAVNVASGSDMAVRNLVYMIAKQLGREDLIQLGALPCSPQDPPSISADVSRLVNEVGWQPIHTLESGVQQTIDWWRTRLAAETLLLDPVKTEVGPT